MSEDYVIHTNSYSSDKKIRANVVAEGSASEDTKGIVRLATEEEALEGTNRSAVITPYTLKKATNYVHTQGEASDLWTIEHNLNKMPSIMTVDSAGNVVEGAEKYIDENTVEILFNGAFKGRAYLN